MSESSTETLEILAPFMPRAVVIELCSGRHLEEYKRRKIEMLQNGAHRAIWMQRQMGRENAGRETRALDGIRHRATIDPMIYGMARQKYGEDCWQDKDFREHTYKRSPELMVPDPPRRSFPVNGFKDVRSAGHATQRRSDAPSLRREAAGPWSKDGHETAGASPQLTKA